MSSLTKNAILDAFLRIAAKKPLEKITVRDIVDECGVNRNTFYYYFQDIYAVLEELCRIGAATVPEGLSLSETVSTLYLKWADFAAEHPRTVRNLVISLGVDGAERYFAPELNDLLFPAVIRDTAEQPLTVEMQRLTVDLIRHAFVGVCFDLVRERSLSPQQRAKELWLIAESFIAGLRQTESDRTPPSLLPEAEALNKGGKH